MVSGVVPNGNNTGTILEFKPTENKGNSINGQYMISAIAAAFNSKAKYIEEPLLEKAEKENKPLSHEEQMEKVKRVFQSLQIMQSNFELSKMKKENEGGVVS